MDNEYKIKTRLIERINSEIKEYENDLKELLEKKEKVLKLDPSDEIVFADNSNTYDEIILVLQVGMRFADKYGRHGIIKKINSDRLSLLCLNTDTDEEETIEISIIVSLWNE